jgi:hypothetical protein
MSNARTGKVAVQVHFNPDNPTDYTQMGFEVWSQDGTDLTAQSIIDAISDALIDVYPLTDEGDAEVPTYDA